MWDQTAGLWLNNKFERNLEGNPNVIILCFINMTYEAVDQSTVFSCSRDASLKWRRIRSTAGLLWTRYWTFRVCRSSPSLDHLVTEDCTLDMFHTVSPWGVHVSIKMATPSNAHWPVCNIDASYWEGPGFKSRHWKPLSNMCFSWPVHKYAGIVPWNVHATYFLHNT